MAIEKDGLADPNVKPTSGPDERTVHAKSAVLTDIPAVIAADLRVDVGAPVSTDERPRRARTLTPTPPPGV
ncbi:MAG: hypothetical protein JWM53_892, partial [bacterium]|nr:hypothetical protein [bacterium]